jgi:putative transposase
MFVMKTQRYKLYPSKRNKHLDEAINVAASVWNYCIAMHRGYYRFTGKYLSSYKLKKHITKLKGKKRYASWNQLGSQAIQDVVERIDRSYKAFFQYIKDRKAGVEGINRKSIPHFRKCRKYKSFTLKQCGYKFSAGNTVTILGRNYKYWNYRPLEGTVKTVTVKRNGQGDFYLFVVCENEFAPVVSRAGKAAGYDFGMKHFLTADDGKIINSPLFFKQSLKDLRAAHRAVSHCKNSSNNWKRAVKRLAKTDEHVANKRRDWFFKLARGIARENSVICLESLDIKAMQRLWGRKISDVAFSEFESILKWEALKTGTKVVHIDKWYPSSKTCSVCGAKNPGLTLSDRTWVCPHCGTRLDRDVNAAINIKREGLRKLNLSA